MSNISELFPKFKLVEQKYISELMYLTNNNITKAVELSGISRATLYRKLKKYKVHIYAEVMK